MPPPVTLVTGAAGFIGSHLVDRRLKAGWRVVGIDNLSRGRISHLREALQHPRFTLIAEDLKNEERCLRRVRAAVARLSGRIVTLWHLAANSDIRAGVADPRIDLDDTFLSTFHILSLARKLGIPEAVFTSSAAVYGDREQVLLDDLGPWTPISPYGAMKLGGEGLFSAAAHTHLKSAWVLRLPNVIGSRQTHGVIRDFLLKLKRDPTKLEVLGDGLQKKPYLHVSDLLTASDCCYAGSRKRLNCFNIASSDPGLSVREIARMTVREIAPTASICFGSGRCGWLGDIPRYRYASEKLAALGWKPQLSGRQAVRQAIAELKAEIFR